MLSPTAAGVRKHLRFNFAMGLFDGGFFGLGMGFSSFSAIVPLFVHHLTESALLIGLVPAIHNMGWQLPQLLTAGWLARSRRFKPLTLWMTIHERLPFLGLAVLALAAASSTKLTVLLVTFGMLVWQGFGAGMAANPWTSLVSKVIPPELHGTFFGTQSAAFNGLAGVSALLAGLILDRATGAIGFSICFALTFFCMVISFAFLAATREADSEPAQVHQDHSFLRQSLHILGTDPNFRTFLAVRVLSQFAGMGFGFYVIYAVQQYTLSDAAAAALVSILLIGQVVLSPLMGRLGDRWSHRGVMSLGALGAALSALLAWRAGSSDWFYAVFLLEAVAVVAIWTIPLALSVSFAKTEAERPLYIGMANTLPAPAAILAPVIAGWIADAIGYGTMFLAAAGSGILMALALWFWLKDPERVPARDVAELSAGA
jgi:MFS family permease